jgi:hypothetical protein
MGRHKIYHTPEEKAIANRTKSKRYYERYCYIILPVNSAISHYLKVQKWYKQKTTVQVCADSQERKSF